MDPNIKSLRNRIIEVDSSRPFFLESRFPVPCGWKSMNSAVTMLYDDIEPMSVEYTEYGALYWLSERLEVLCIF